MRRSLVFIVLILSQLLLLAVMIFVAGRIRSVRSTEELPAKVVLVRSLSLTDLAIWTEARYTRHPSQADHFSAFQDLPASLEHFPAGSVVGAPSASSPAPSQRP